MQPADPYVRLTINGIEGGPNSPTMDDSIYREAVGSLMFLMVCTRPDIAFSVGQVAQFSHNPKQVHWTAVQRVLAYLKGTSKYGITYGETSHHNVLTAFSDFDYAGDSDT
jgi:hypothetical protein